MERQNVPCWIKKRAGVNDSYIRTKALLKELSLNTVCESAVCPNIYECFCKNYATFMILGNKCTRDCRFCGVDRLSEKDEMVIDSGEPARIAGAVKKMGMGYVVITSPTRDDLADGGASQFAALTKLLKYENPPVRVELLVPDFNGDEKSLMKVIDARPDVISHNMETVQSLYRSVRPSSDYARSLKVLEKTAKKGAAAKSGFMLGLGEKKEEVLDLMEQIKQTGCAYLVIGQYLKPSKDAVDVQEFIHPDIFKEYEEAGRSMGFKNIFAGTFCRSSYMAEQLVEEDGK